MKEKTVCLPISLGSIEKRTNGECSIKCIPEMFIGKIILHCEEGKNKNYFETFKSEIISKIEKGEFEIEIRSRNPNHKMGKRVKVICFSETKEEIFLGVSTTENNEHLAKMKELEKNSQHWIPNTFIIELEKEMMV